MGDGNSWERLEAFTKRELADNFFEGKESELQFKMTNEILNPSNYKAHDYIRPAHVFRLRQKELGESFHFINLGKSTNIFWLLITNNPKSTITDLEKNCGAALENGHTIKGSILNKKSAKHNITSVCGFIL